MKPLGIKESFSLPDQPGTINKKGSKTNKVKGTPAYFGVDVQFIGKESPQSLVVTENYKDLPNFQQIKKYDQIASFTLKQGQVVRDLNFPETKKSDTKQNKTQDYTKSSVFDNTSMNSPGKNGTKSGLKKSKKSKQISSRIANFLFQYNFSETKSNMFDGV